MSKSKTCKLRSSGALSQCWFFKVKDFSLPVRQEDPLSWNVNCNAQNRASCGKTTPQQASVPGFQRLCCSSWFVQMCSCIWIYTHTHRSRWQIPHAPAWAVPNTQFIEEHLGTERLKRQRKSQMSVSKVRADPLFQPVLLLPNEELIV